MERMYNKYPLVSILIPAYNRARYLPETINSVLNQEYQNTELIVLDDGSTDNTREVLSMYNDQLYYETHENMGETKTVNKGLKMARGDYLCVVNSDDPILPGALKRLVYALKKESDALVAYPDWVEIDENSKRIQEIRLQDYNLYNMLKDFCVSIGPGVLIRRQTLKLIGLRDSKYSYVGDLEYWFRVALYGKLVHVPEILATHRVHKESASTQFQGGVMANELVDLVKKTTENKNFPPELYKQKQLFLKKALEISLHFCGQDEKALNKQKEKIDSIKKIHKIYNCLQISSEDVYGSRFNGYDLSNKLRNFNIDSSNCVLEKRSHNDQSVSEVYSGNKKHRKILQKHAINLNTYYSTSAHFYPFSYDILFSEKFLNSDVIHLHLIHNFFFNISDLPLFTILKPVVWTLHDPWALTGHCVHPGKCERWLTGCGDCPRLDTPISIKADTTSLNWMHKKLIFRNCDLDIIVSSKWMYEKVNASPFFKKSRIHRIPFGIDLDIFKPKSNLAIRKTLGIPDNNFVICFRATDNEWKGFDYILQGLNYLKHERKDITLIVLNDKGMLRKYENSFQIIELGVIFDIERLINILNASDLFLMPSRAESFGMMAIEAMACGKPGIVMNGTALPEIVKPEESGWQVVEQGDVLGMVDCIYEIYKSSAKRNEIGARAREAAQKHYNENIYVQKIKDVYLSAINNRDKKNQSDYIIEQLKKLNHDKNELHRQFDLDQAASELIEYPESYKLFIRLHNNQKIYNFYKKIIQPINKKYSITKFLNHILRP
jgi:glycosyltransferase involved in cell wall biosynthesis/GT2 family glycosyltransferase